MILMFSKYLAPLISESMNYSIVIEFKSFRYVLLLLK